MSQTPWSSPDGRPEDEPPQAPPERPQPNPQQTPQQTPPPNPNPQPDPQRLPPPTQAPPQQGWGAPPPQQGWGAPPPNQYPNQQYPNQPGNQPWPPNQPWGAPPPGQWSATGPGIIPLRPLTLSDIYDGAIRAVRFNPRTMIGFSALVIAIVTLVLTFPQAALAPLLADNAVINDAGEINAGDVAELISGLSLSVLLPSLSYLVVTTVITAFLITAVDAAVRGQKLGPGEVWRVCRGRLPAVLGLAVVNLLFAVLAGVVLIAPGVILLITLDDAVAGVLVLVFGVLVAIPVLISVLLGWWALAAPALLLENLSIVAALRRSARLVRRSFWRVVGIGLLTAILTNFISGLIGVPLGLIGIGVTELMDSGVFLESLISTASSNVGSVIAGAIVYPFSAAVSALLYLDLRMRREGLDVQLMSGR